MEAEQMKLLRKEVNGVLLDLTTKKYNGGNEIQNWKEFLKNGIFTYKYPFSEQFQIHEQARKSGTKARAAASPDVWDKFPSRRRLTAKRFTILKYGTDSKTPVLKTWT